MDKKNISKIVLVLIFLALLVCLYTTSIIDYDVWFHLKTGEDIVKEGSLPSKDAYSYTTTADNKMVMHEWLFQVLFYLVFSFSGFNGLIILKVLVILLTLYILSKTIELDVYLKLGILTVVAFLARSHSFERPHIFFWLLLALLLYFIKKKEYYYLPPLVLIWANLHSSVIIALVIIGAYFMPSVILKKDLKKLLLLALSFVASLINPYTYHVLTYSFENAPFAPYIKEWMPFELTNPYLLLFIAYLAATVLFMIVSYRKTKKLNISDIALVLLFSYLAFTSKRNVIVAGIVLTPILANEINKAGLVVKEGRVKDVFLSVVFVGLIIFSISNLRGFTLGVQETTFPSAPINFIKENNITGNVFNEYAYGGYIIWSLYPESKVFIDGRNVMYGTRIFSEFYVVKNAGPGWQNLVEDYNVSYFFIQQDAAVGKELANDKRWKLAYFDDVVIIFVRNDSKVRAIDYVGPYITEMPDTLEETNNAIDEYEYLLKINPSFASGHKNIGLLYLNINQKEKAIYHFEEYIKLKPTGENSDKLREVVNELRG